MQTIEQQPSTSARQIMSRTAYLAYFNKLFGDSSQFKEFFLMDRVGLVEITDVAGKVVMVTQLPTTTQQRHELDLTDLNAGSYIVRLTQNDEMAVFKIMKQ